VVDDFHGKDATPIVITTAIYNVPQLAEIAKESMTRIADAVEDHKGNWDKRYY
jgi:hypothetical protein